MLNSKLRIIATTSCVYLLLTHSQASATLVSYNGYTLDTSTSIVTNTATGLEWLQWRQTSSLSIKQALDTYSAQGWGLAGNDQMNDMFADFGMNVPTDENATATTIAAYNGALEVAPHDRLIDLFGATFMPSDPGYSTTNPLEEVHVSFGSDSDGDGLYNYAWIRSDYTWYAAGVQINNEPYAAVYGEDIIKPHTVHYNFGVALTRSASVPTPATLTIFALGLMGLALRRRKNRIHLSE